MWLKWATKGGSHRGKTSNSESKFDDDLLI